MLYFPQFSNYLFFQSSFFLTLWIFVFSILWTCFFITSVSISKYPFSCSLALTTGYVVTWCLGILLCTHWSNVFCGRLVRSKVKEGPFTVVLHMLSPSVSTLGCVHGNEHPQEPFPPNVGSWLKQKGSFLTVDSLCLLQNLPDQNFIKGVSMQGSWLSVIISVPTSQRHRLFSLYGSSTQESQFLSPTNSYQDNYHITSEAYCIFLCQSPLVLGPSVHVKGFLLCCFYNS